MLQTLLIVVVLLIAAILVFASTRPDSFRIQREASINAKPETLFALIDDLKAWQQWSPWEKKDPAMQRTFGAVTSGKGAVYEWLGDKNVGQGSMEIIESQPYSKIAIKLVFL